MNVEKLGRIAEAEGFIDVDALLEAAITDSVVPGICMECDAVTDSEPDARANWCESCGRARAVSCLVLAGLI